MQSSYIKLNLSILILVVIFTSCHFPRYIHSGDVTSSLDFRKGKWLLNKIESPKNINLVLTKIAEENFLDVLEDRFVRISQSKGILLPQKTNNKNLSKIKLKEIKSGTGFDYFINIKTKTNKNEIGDFQIGSVDFPLENNVEVNLDIYDLNLLEKIYTHSVTGILTVQKNNQDFVFAKGAEKLMVKGLKKIMKKIKKNQRKV